MSATQRARREAGLRDSRLTTHFSLRHSILGGRRSVELLRLQCVHSEQVELRAGNLASIVRQSQTLRDAGRRGKGLRGRGEGKSDGDGRKLHLDNNAIEAGADGDGRKGKWTEDTSRATVAAWNAWTVLLVRLPRRRRRR